MKEIKREILKEDVKGNKEVAYTLLEARHPLFVNETVIKQEEIIEVVSVLNDDMYDWEVLNSFTLEEKVRHLINCGHIYTELKQSKYTYIFGPEHLVFTINGLPKLTSKGVEEQVFPYDSLTEEAFLTTYQAMIISLIDTKVDYDILTNGKLPFYKGDLFCESIAKTQAVDETLQLLQEKYIQEKTYNIEHYTRVKNNLLSKWKISTIVASVIAFLSFIGIGYLLIFALPSQTTVSDVRLAFIQQDYSKVISTAKAIDSKSLSQDDKYIVAYSVIMSEPLTEAQKKELSRISTQSNSDYLRYWVLIGQSKIDEAIDIASFLDDPQLLMYGMTKKIDEIQRDPNLKSEERTEKINSYKSKLDELKKKYLTSPSNAPSKENNTSTSNGQ